VNESFVEQFPAFLVEQQSTPQLSEGAAYTSLYFLSRKEHKITSQENKKLHWAIGSFF